MTYTKTVELNRNAVFEALSAIIADLDYDLHKAIECSEDDGKNHYGEVVDQFIEYYKFAMGVDE